MALTFSDMLELGTKFPHFELFDVISEKQICSKEKVESNVSVVMFLCSHCPYVKFLNEKIGQLSRTYSDKGVVFLGINPNDLKESPEDDPFNMKLQASKYSFNFPYMLDTTQEVARAFKAACTPEFYVFDKNESLVYRGQFDNTRISRDVQPSGDVFSSVLDEVIEGKVVTAHQIPSIGCGIKWKVGCNS